MSFLLCSFMYFLQMESSNLVYFVFSSMPSFFERISSSSSPPAINLLISLMGKPSYSLGIATSDLSFSLISFANISL